MHICQNLGRDEYAPQVTFIKFDLYLNVITSKSFDLLATLKDKRDIGVAVVIT